MLITHIAAAAGTAAAGATTPSWIAVGTESAVGSGNVAPAYGTNASGDLFVMVVAGRISALTTPSGWTLQGGPNEQSGRRVYILTRDTRSSGSESGTVSVTNTNTGCIATIHTFRNVATSSFVEDVTNGGSAANGSTLTAPDITAGGNNRLAIFAAGSGTDTAEYDSVSGASGGTWTMRHESTVSAGSNASYCLQTAALDSGGTISGGTDTVTGIDEHSVVGLALVGT